MIISSQQHENLKITIKQRVLCFLSIVIIISICNQPHKVNAGIGCTGKFVNPITDVCWSCLFPITLAGVKIVGGGGFDTKSTKNPICFCSRPGVPVPVPGIPVGFWEPVRLVDVTKSPMCMVSLGGISLGTSPQKGVKSDEGTAFYHVH